MNQKIDITSTAIEKGIDMAKDFLNKLIMPAAEETGLLIRDQVTRWRFNNQVKILNKTKNYCEQHHIDPKAISLKLLVPLLDYSGLEEDEALQDKWSILLGNMVDSDQNVENHVFPYILSQISKNEYDIAEAAYESKRLRLNSLARELHEFLAEKPMREESLTREISELKLRLDETNLNWMQTQPMRDAMYKLEGELRIVRHQESSFRYRMQVSEEINTKKAQEFELSNLIRLGVVKEIREPYANSKKMEIANNPDNEYIVFDIDLDLESNDSFVLTELGELFIQACSEKLAK